MNDAEAAKVVEAVNASGFPFQRRVAWEIMRTASRHGFVVEGEEVGWANDRGRQGFIDLVASKGRVCLVVECKRRGGGPWIFLPGNPDARRSTLPDRILFVDHGTRSVGVGNANLRNVDVESNACVVPGGPRDERRSLGDERRSLGDERRSLEPTAFGLVEATKGLAQQLAREGRNIRTPERRLMVPILVTNLPLRVCDFSAEHVSIDDGQVPLANTNVVEVPFLRFRKGFAVTSTSLRQSGVAALAEDRERSVFIVQAAELERFLTELNVEAEASRGDGRYGTR